MMHGQEKSDPSIVAKKPANKPGQPGAESVERRGGPRGTRESHARAGHRAGKACPRGWTVYGKQQGKEEGTVHRAAAPRERRSAEGGVFLAQAQCGAGGGWADVEGSTSRTWKPTLVDLHARVHRGAYRALPSRRQYIPKADGRQRPLGIAALEDKIVQRAVVEVLNAIYEEDFLGFSYGFRPGRSQHDALDALAVGITRTKVNWILDADIRSFFDSVSHEWLIRFVEHRIGDQRVIRLIRKWLKAGVMEDGVIEANRGGHAARRGRLTAAGEHLPALRLRPVGQAVATAPRSRATSSSCATPTISLSALSTRPRPSAFWRICSERMEKFALSLHPDKTRLIEFGRFAAANRARRGLGKPETFNFLGFTHICGRSRSGGFQLKRKSRRDRMRAKLREIKEALRRRMHDSIPEQGKWLAQVVRGYFALPRGAHQRPAAWMPSGIT